MTKLLLIFMFIFCAVPMLMEARRPGVTSYSPTRSCPTPFLQHGRSRVRPRTHSVRYICDLNYELVGSRYATCRGGEWDEPMPICIRPGCKLPSLSNILAVRSRDDAWVIFFCFPGHKLVGSPAIYCDGHKWNATAPSCVAESTPPQLSCDFEARDLCGWRQDELHDFDWKRHNQKTPSSFAFTGPSYDHTLGRGNTGYYMYIESSSRYNNDSARLISPVFDASLSKNGCFSFFYHMFGRTIGGLRVYQVPDQQNFVNLTEAEKPDLLLFEKWGNQGDIWFGNVSKLKNMSNDFQIVIEGIRGRSFTSDIAIDDVAILQGDQCAQAAVTAVTPPDFPPDSCSGRCDVFGNPAQERGCGCTVSCLNDDNCCSDFFDLCVFAAGTTDSDEDSSSEPPRTEKLIGSNTTTPKPTTVPAETTTTPPRHESPSTVKPPTTAKLITTKATKTTTIATRIIVTTARTTAKTTKATTPAPRTTTERLTTVRPTTARAMSMTTKRQLTTSKWAKLDADKERKEKEISKKNTTVQPKGSSVPAILLTMLALALCVALAMVALRSARGRAALARLRGRAAGDPEVRYLTHDTD